MSRRPNTPLRYHRSQSEKGFTIVELMIALSVLSVVLVLSAIIMIQLGRMFTKGNNEANTQNTARNIMNEIASEIQLNANIPVEPSTNTPLLGVICIGTQRYNYRTDYELNGVSGTPGGTNSSPNSHVLWRDTMTSSGTCKPIVNFAVSASPSDILTKPGTGVELIGRKMRLMDDFGVALNNNSFTVKVTIAYGDDDLVQHTAVGAPTHCLGGDGTQYCAVSSLTQTVTRRLTN